MRSKKYTKICYVCGEKANGYNFCAITCESCKAFFRRNASKLDAYKCPFDDSCHISVVTRKSCRKCRLKKCFSVGMRQEWILNENERELRRHKIEENRKWKQTCNKNLKSVDSALSQSPDSTNVDINDINDNSHDISDDQIITNIIEIEDYLKSEEMDEKQNHEICDKTYQMAMELELSVIPFPKPLGDYSFTEVECNRLLELFSASIDLENPLSHERSVCEVGQNLEQIASFFIKKFEFFVQKLIKVSKGLTAFKNMCDNDQLALVKYGSLEVLLMRTALYFSSESESWTFTLDSNNKILFKLDILKAGKRDVYQLFKTYLLNICEEWDSDPFVLDLLMTIILFDPNRPNLIHKDLVKLQQHIYMYLLQRYLRLRCGSECEAKSKFLKLINVLQDLHKLNESYKQNYIEKDHKQLNTGPLVKEILDINY